MSEYIDVFYREFCKARDSRCRAESWIRTVEVGKWKHKVFSELCQSPKIALWPPGVDSFISATQSPDKWTIEVPDFICEIILERVLENWKDEVKHAVEVLRKREVECLKECQGYLDYLQEKINKAKKEGDKDE